MFFVGLVFCPLMSIVNILTPAEKRFLIQALQQDTARRVLEDANEQQQRQESSLQQGGSSSEKKRTQPLCLPPVKKKKSRPKPQDAVDRFLQQIHQENELWEVVERSLEYPFVYRSDKNKALCLKMLRRIGLLQSLPESDLEGVASHMEIVRMRTKEVILGKVPSSSSDSLLKVPDLVTSVVSGDSVSSISCGVSPNQPHLEKEAVNQSFMGTLSDNRYVYVLLRGSVALRMPSIQSSMEAFVEPYEMFGLPLIIDALPLGSWYETTGDCVLLRLERDIDLLLDRVISDIEKKLVEERVHFLRQQLRVKVFTYWTLEEYEMFARSLIPLRLSWRQLVVGQGMDSDALYFIKEGNCVVVRNVPFFCQQKMQKRVSSPLPSTGALLRRHSSGRRPDGGGKPSNTAPEAPRRSSPSLSPSPSSAPPPPPMKLVELVTLREGEFFGELGLLNHNVDWKPGVDAIWSEAYWKDTLDRALCAPVDYTALEDNLPWLSSQCDVTDGPTANCSSVSPERGERVFPSTLFPRQANVYTKCPCVLYMLTYERCRQLFGEREYAQLKEFAKGYPSCENIEDQYERQRRWAQYRKALVRDVLMGSKNPARQKEKLPHFHVR